MSLLHKSQPNPVQNSGQASVDLMDAASYERQAMRSNPASDPETFKPICLSKYLQIYTPPVPAV